MANIPTVLLLFLVNAVTTLGNQNDNYDYPWCPSVVEGCYCRRKYNTDNYIYCEYLGTLNEIPEFNQSDIFFKELHFRYDTQINRVQKDSFEGLQIQYLWLQGLQIQYVDKDAFTGLENTLTHLHLDDNLISVLHRDSLAGLSKLQYLGLHNNLFDSVPILGDDFPDLNYVYFFNNWISVISVNTFKGMGSLRGLKLNNNEIMTLHTGVFDPLVQLNDLELQGNRLGTLPGNIFRYLGELTKLDLSNNRIHTLLTEAFYGLRKLETLHLNHNFLSQFHNGMFTYVTKIKYLTLRHNYARSIQQTTFSLLRNIRTLDLSFNRISTIDTASFGRLYRLVKLYLCGNQLTHLEFFHDSFLGRIEILDLSDNNITQLVDPTVFTSLSKLEQLDLSENSLGNINPGVFRELRLLRILKLARNPLYQLREGVLNHLNLEELDMTHCRLRRIDDKAFALINNINYMWLDNNELGDIPTRLFNNTRNMNILSLRNNSLSKLRRDMFKGLTKLEALHLDWNNLTNITEYSFIFLGGLKLLTITHNQISELYEHSFNDLKSLNTLDLSYNKLTSIGRAFTRFQNIQSITLKGNRLRNMNWFSLFYSTLQNLKLLDLSDCDIETLYLDGLIFSLKTPLEQFKVNIAKNPLSCEGCDLSWSNYIPYNSIISPIDVTCNKPNELKRRPVLCCLDNTCMDDAIKNNSKLHTMCADAEARLLKWAQTTEEPQSNSTTETTDHEDNRDAPTSSPVIHSNTTENWQHVSRQSDENLQGIGLSSTRNYDSTINESETNGDDEYQQIPIKTTQTTMSEEFPNSPVNITESEIGSGEVDKDLMMHIGNNTQSVKQGKVDNTMDADDIMTGDHTTISWSTERTSTSATTTLLALLFTEPIEATTAGGDFMVTSSPKDTTDDKDDYVLSEDEADYLDRVPTLDAENRDDYIPQTTMSQILDKNDNILKELTNFTNDRVTKGLNGNGTDSLIDLLNIKKNLTGFLTDSESSGEPDDLIAQEPLNLYTEDNSTDSNEVNDKLFEVEQLMVVQDSTGPSSNLLDSPFSSGEPDNEVIASEHNITNERGLNPPEELTRTQQPGFDNFDYQNVGDSMDPDKVDDSSNAPNQHPDLSSYAFLEEIDDQYTDD